MIGDHLCQRQRTPPVLWEATMHGAWPWHSGRLSQRACMVKAGHARTHARGWSRPAGDQRTNARLDSRPRRLPSSCKPARGPSSFRCYVGVVLCRRARRDGAQVPALCRQASEAASESDGLLAHSLISAQAAAPRSIHGSGRERTHACRLVMDDTEPFRKCRPTQLELARPPAQCMCVGAAQCIAVAGQVAGLTWQIFVRNSVGMGSPRLGCLCRN